MRWIKGTRFNDIPSHLTLYPPGSHRHFSGQSFATLAGSITNHNQNITAGDVISSDTSTIVSHYGMANCCILHREREELILNVTVFVVRIWGGQYREELILNVTVFVVRVWGGQYRN